MSQINNQAKQNNTHMGGERGKDRARERREGEGKRGRMNLYIGFYKDFFPSEELKF